MTRYLASLEQRLRDAGLEGRLLVVTASGGVLDADTMAAAPIHSINSGPSMAPVAGRYYAEREAGATTAVIADTGGTSYDVGLVRHGRIPWTRESWLGRQYESDLTGFPSVDVKSIGAGGGSIAWVDEGGLLRVGPGSAGADPGPACYGARRRAPDGHRRSGRARVHRSRLLPRWRDRARRRRRAASARARCRQPLNLTVEDAAIAVLRLATEHMVRAIEDITLGRGIDPRDAVLVAGGGAAGINAVAIAKRLGCTRVVFPDLGAALSAVGALISDLTARVRRDLPRAQRRVRPRGGEHRAQRARTTGAGGSPRVPARARWRRGSSSPPRRATPARCGSSRFRSAAPGSRPKRTSRPWPATSTITTWTCSRPATARSPIEVIGWRARVQCQLDESTEVAAAQSTTAPARADATRPAWFAGHPDPLETTVRSLYAIAPAEELVGPAIVESPVTTIVIEPGARAVGTEGGSLVVAIGGDRAADPALGREVAA